MEQIKHLFQQMLKSNEEEIIQFDKIRSENKKITQ